MTALKKVITRANFYREEARKARSKELWILADSLDGKASGLFIAAKYIREQQPWPTPTSNTANMP